ncbi:trypsin-like peptidase domain-containing protein [Floridanema evergladense]|uniref:Trypsin-like peptidase domain-containing protein n=1 Tax=Floridaenema evergladense BLCC-F167 TaxID=3153639 RepID=A0ABV4WQT0_9CYAN
MNTKLLTLAASSLIAARTTLAVFGISSLAATTPLLLNATPASAQVSDEQTNVRVYQKASPAVVSIAIPNGSGSGSIISPDGLILTNAHVVQNASRTLTVTLADGRRLPADVVAFGDRGLDLAVLKIRGQNNLPTIPLARNPVQVGQRAYAIGNPFGRFQGTFTVGIVSRIDRERGLIQTDAAINPGNSGGPLLNSQGELIGVNTAIFTNSQAGGNIGIGFAIAIDRIQPFLTSVRQGTAPRVAQTAPRSRRSTNPPQALTLNGELIADRLGPGDNVLPTDNSFFKAYRFEGRAGQQVRIDMVSREIDPFLILIAPNGRTLAQDYNSGGNRNARIVTSLPISGTYLLIANSYQGGEVGSFELRAMASRTGLRNPNIPQGQTRSIIQLQGTLGPGAPRLPSDGSWYRSYTFDGVAGQPIRISLESPDFNTYLALLGPDGRKVAENNNVGRNNQNSALDLTLPFSGTYRVIVNASEPGVGGRYRLVIR